MSFLFLLLLLIIELPSILYCQTYDYTITSSGVLRGLNPVPDSNILSLADLINAINTNNEIIDSSKTTKIFILSSDVSNVPSYMWCQTISYPLQITLSQSIQSQTEWIYDTWCPTVGDASPMFTINSNVEIINLIWNVNDYLLYCNENAKFTCINCRISISSSFISYPALISTKNIVTFIDSVFTNIIVPSTANPIFIVDQGGLIFNNCYFSNINIPNFIEIENNNIDTTSNTQKYLTIIDSNIVDINSNVIFIYCYSIISLNVLPNTINIVNTYMEGEFIIINTDDKGVFNINVILWFISVLCSFIIFFFFC